MPPEKSFQGMMFKICLQKYGSFMLMMLYICLEKIWFQICVSVKFILCLDVKIYIQFKYVSLLSSDMVSRFIS